MTATEVATAIIDKLQNENRILLETVHKAQDTIKYSERQIADKDRHIKVLEERIRTGNDGILEISNRQKDLTIKHLELQIDNLLKEKEDLEIGLEAIKAQICPRCETKLLQSENKENRNIKSYKPPGKTKPEKKLTETQSYNRVKALERIMEHKDNRIAHLSKEIQRLTKVEKELTQKVYRLTKLLPMSRLPPEAVTDCLLKEIQLLESEKQGGIISDETLLKLDNFNKLKKNVPSVSRAPLSKLNPPRSLDKVNKSAQSMRTSTITLPESEQTDASDINKAENQVLFNKLQKLCNDINELKRLFAFESEKISYDLNSATSEYHEFKKHLEELINNLNDVVQNILRNNRQKDDVLDPSISSDDDKYVISCLQERLKDSLAMITEYENENKTLKEKLSRLKPQLIHQSSYSDYRKSEEKYKSFSDSQLQNTNDVKKLQEIIKMKDCQLESAESHISSCQKFIEDLQRNRKHTSDNSKAQCPPISVDQATSTYDQQNKELQMKLDVAERNIKTCENVIELLQDKVQHMEEENARIETELHAIKSKAVSEIGYQSGLLNSRLSESHVSTLKKFNEELQDKVKTLEEANAKLEVNQKTLESKNVLLEASEQQKSLLKSKLDASEKAISTLEQSVEILQSKLKSVEEERDKIKSQLKIVEDEKSKVENKLENVTLINNLAETYENDVMALKNKLILKEEENRELKESLHNLEHKTLEMNYHRKTLHEEIEKLCDSLMENEESEDSERRKAIYKAAVLHSAQALLRLDANYRPNDSDSSSALDELKHQIQVYLTEVSRIHELVTIKEQERYDLLKEYLDLEDDTLLKPSPPRHHESHVQSQPTDHNLQSSNVDPLQTQNLPTSERLSKSATRVKNVKFSSSMSVAELKLLQEELDTLKGVTNYLLTSCTQLEKSLSKEKTERAKCEKELEMCQVTIKDLSNQLDTKENIAKRLSNMIEMMRLKEYNDETQIEQLKRDMKQQSEENQKVMLKVIATETELCKCKHENEKIQLDLDSVKRELVNEQFENAKVKKELKHLRHQISNSQFPTHEV